MGRRSFARFVVEQWYAVPELEKQDLSEQTVLVVGANVGLGLEAAKHLARMGPGKLVLACRSIKKAEDAAKEIEKTTGFNLSGAYAVDLSVFSSVNAFVAEFESKEERLDILIYNAGIATRDYQATGDGFEETIQVNDLSCSLVCIGLLPLMLKTSEATASASHRPRITVVSSAVHFQTQPTPEQLSSPNYLLKINDTEHCKEPGVMAARYLVSKLLNILFVRELAARVPHTKVVVNTVSPGYCYSSLRRKAGLFDRFRMSILDLVLGNTTEQGGRRVAWAAIADRHCEKRMHGAYTAYMEITEESDWAISEEGYATQRRIWNETVDVLTQISPKFQQVVQTHLL
ncbi:NAD(P)-binding protein [Peniophora sp. CONT]|nr:NAD(P)-binding protein [Peniophora sp. CONT]